MTRDELDERKRRREERAARGTFVGRMHRDAATKPASEDFHPKPSFVDPDKPVMYWLEGR